MPMRVAIAWIVLTGSLACTEPNPDAGQHASTTEGTAGETSDPPPTTDVDTTAAADATSATETTDAIDTGTDECPLGTHTCVAGPPEGWSGPVAVMLDAAESAPPPCEGDYDEDARMALHDLVGDPAICECDCAEATDVSCESWVVEHDVTLGCPTPDESFDFLGICLNAPSEPQGHYWRADPAASSGGSCEASGTTDVSPAAFAGRTTLCAYAGPQDGCGPGQRCAPIPVAPFESAICVWQEGDLECPAALGFTEKRVAFDDFTDDRACEECTCADPVGTCSVELSFFSDSCAGRLDYALPTDGVCRLIGSSVESINADEDSLAIEATCVPSSGVPIGAVTGTGPTTICCTN
jgi:hypothetical protein